MNWEKKLHKNSCKIWIQLIYLCSAPIKKPKLVNQKHQWAKNGLISQWMILWTTVRVVAQLPQKLKTKSIHFYLFFLQKTCLDCTLLRAELDRARLRLSVEWQWRDCKHPEDRCRLNAKLRPLEFSCWFFCAFVEEDWFCCCCCCWDGVLLLFLTELRLWRDVVVVVAPLLLLLLLLFLTPLLPLLASAAMLPPEPLLDEIANFDDGVTATLPLLLLL